MLKIINLLRQKFHSKKLKKKCISNDGTKFFLNSYITNQNDIDKILIGKRCLISGHLLVHSNSKGIIVGDETYIGENTKIWSAEKIIIGSNVLISFGVNIMDNDSHPISAKLRQDHFKKVYNANSLENLNDTNKNPIIISDDVWIGFNSTILKGVKIGKGAIIASGSVVTKDVEEYTIVAGNPARQVSFAQK